MHQKIHVDDNVVLSLALTAVSHTAYDQRPRPLRNNHVPFDKVSADPLGDLPNVLQGPDPYISDLGQASSFSSRLPQVSVAGPIGNVNRSEMAL